MVTLHAAEKVHTYYINLGFLELNEEDEICRRRDFKKHIDKMKIASTLKPFILENKTCIHQSRRSFVNHVYIDLDEINFPQQA